MSEKLAFRGYTFFAGNLQGMRVSDVSDEDLAWAVNFNRGYMATYDDPEAWVQFNRKNMRVGSLPDGVARRRYGFAAEALRCCVQEQAYRADAKLRADTAALPRSFDPDESKPAGATQVPSEALRTRLGPIRKLADDIQAELAVEILKARQLTNNLSELAARLVALRADIDGLV